MYFVRPTIRYMYIVHVPVAYWLKCCPVIERVQAFFTHEYTQVHPQNDEVFITASFVYNRHVE